MLFTFDPAEKTVLQRLDGRVSIGQVASATKLDVYEVCKIIYRFVEAGMLELIGHEQPKTNDLETSSGSDDQWLSTIGNAMRTRHHSV